MEMLNRAIGDADAFVKLMQKVERPSRDVLVVQHQAQEVADWNAAVDRKKAERQQRRAAKAWK
jgi:hypothetical protein